jgi:hypothetical protein
LPGSSVVPANTNGPPAADWNTKYLKAPGTAVHDTEIRVSETAVAVTVTGAAMSCSLAETQSSDPAQALSPDNAPTTTNDRIRDLVDTALMIRSGDQ